MRKLIVFVVAMSILLLVGCAKPVPAEKSAFVGEWKSQDMEVLITQEGSVMYRRVRGNVTKSIEGPLQGFEGDDFVVGVGPMKVTFVVSTPPHEVGGEWKMVVDGVELTRVDES